MNFGLSGVCYNASYLGYCETIFIEITFFIGYYNCTNRTLKYVNAGHNYPILSSGNDFKLLNKGCIGLGMFEKLPKVEMEELIIKPNDILVCYTDGLVELENDEGESMIKSLRGEAGSIVKLNINNNR